VERQQPVHRLGSALVEALDELIQSGHINPQLALQTLNQVSSPTPSRMESSLEG
jgi:transcription initiation factor TFIIA small subunit